MNAYYFPNNTLGVHLAHDGKFYMMYNPNKFEEFLITHSDTPLKRRTLLEGISSPELRRCYAMPGVKIHKNFENAIHDKYGKAAAKIQNAFRKYQKYL